MKKSTQNFILAIIFILSVLSLFFYIVVNRIGGDEALFLIIGHISGWLAAIVIYHWRKKPKEDASKESTEDTSGTPTAGAN